MTLGALIDLGNQIGLPTMAETIQAGVQSMGLPKLSIRCENVKKYGFRATKVHVEHPPEHAHRHLHHITEMIDSATAISDPAKLLAHRIFMQVARAEARVHGSTIEKVHFHEVGAIDSIADIVGTAIAMTALEIDQIYASAIPTGTGTVTIAHGKVSVPAPATAEILRDVPIAACDVEAELTTPTGAAILKATAVGFGPLPAMTPTAIGYGAGTMDLPGQANVLRVTLGDLADSTTADTVKTGSAVESDRTIVLETNIDDSTAEQLADAADRLMEAGALDVFQTPCTMKKGRAAIQLTVICRPTDASNMEAIVFEHTSSIGIRRHFADRHKLVRRAETVETRFGNILGKVVGLPNGRERFSVEDDVARKTARSHKVTTGEVRTAAISSWESRSGQ